MIFIRQAILIFITAFVPTLSFSANSKIKENPSCAIIYQENVSLLQQISKTMQSVKRPTDVPILNLTISNDWQLIAYNQKILMDMSCPQKNISLVPLYAAYKKKMMECASPMNVSANLTSSCEQLVGGPTWKK